VGHLKIGAGIMPLLYNVENNNITDALNLYLAFGLMAVHNELLRLRI
jgi:hypothetical protein